MTKLYYTSLLWLYCILSLSAQSQHDLIQSFLDQHYAQQGLTKTDITNWQISSQHQSSTSGATHVYFHQLYQGIRVANGTANVAIKDGKIISMGNRLLSNLQMHIQYTSPKINPKEAIKKAAVALEIAPPKNLKILEAINSHHFIYNTGGISKENIPVELVYYSTNDQKIHLAWDLSIYILSGEHWWSAKIDAQTGELLNVTDWVIHCNFDHGGYKTGRHTHTHQATNKPNPIPKQVQQPNQYTVFALPSESPNHGNQSIVTNPANVLASPYGWHDTNGAVGAEYTITRGNNVFAYEDRNNDNLPGFSPDGGTTLEFNFPYLDTSNTNYYQAAAITNLFYVNNMMHDIWYQYGFDEASGNFQANNYGRGGSDNDYVFAEAQDGAGTNNANFATPRDGINPRMQMFLWNTANNGNYLNINSPSGIVGSYYASNAAFGPRLPTTPITADLALIEDVTADNDGCDSLTNAATLTGKIVVIDRGNCYLVNKVAAAEAAGAVAVIIVNNVNTAVTQITGAGNTIGIPSIMISQSDGNTIKAQIQAGSVNGSISNAGIINTVKDGDFDNGIIAHEYGHGISTRLTGGANNSNCLSNSEQMGEGWSDWFGLMLTIEPGDVGADIRGIGTYASNQPVTGRGIRPAPYSTDFAVNSFTYGSSNNTTQISEPHGVGFIFATVLWDLTWALIDQYGGVPDSNLYTGTGGNNIAMKLVIEGLKLQPCNPGMIDGRNAILQADQLLYNGAHQCLIWKVFAKRGFGFSASQGSATSRSDQIEAFDIPRNCLTVTQTPTAKFSPNAFSSCTPAIAFTDSSTNTPQSWHWTFGDGSTSTAQNPIHTYNNSGVYPVKLVVTNSLGKDSITQTIAITLPNPPITNAIEVCAGDTAYIPTIASGTARWRDTTNVIIYLGDTLTVPNMRATATYYVENVVTAASIKVGPTNGNIGTGAYHSSNYYGALNFTANRSLEILSAWVDANGAGSRTFYIASGNNSNGSVPSANNIVDQVTVNLVNGPQRVNLNLNVPAAGNYNIGAQNANLYRNQAGANYPYTAPGYLSITSSSSHVDPNNFYYYLYDLEIRDPACVSIKDTVIINPALSTFSFSNTNGTLTFTDASINASSWFWDFGDGDTSTTQNPTHVYNSTGTYNVSLTINNGICSSTQTIRITLISIDPLNKQQLSMALLPNPSQEQTTLTLGCKLEEDAQIQVLDIAGKICQQHVLPKGQTIFNLELSDLPAAVYLVQLKGKNFNATQKLVVE